MDRQRIEYLLTRHFDGDCTPEEAWELGALLSADASLRERFWRESQFHALVRRSLARAATSRQMEEIPSSSEQPAARAAAPAEPTQTSGRRVAALLSGLRGLAHDFAQQPVAVAILVLAMIFGGVLIWNLSQLPPTEMVQIPAPQVESPPSVAISPAAPLPVTPQTVQANPEVRHPNTEIRNPVVAHLKRSVGAVWETLEKPLADGDALASRQELKLVSGLAEIVFDTGAKVILEGPAELVLGNTEVGMRNAELADEKTIPHSALPLPHSAHNSCQLALGKLVARVPEAAHGFTVHTPTLKIVDLGTEFGVQVNLPAQSEIPSTQVQVFQGLIEVQPQLAQAAVAPSQPSQAIRLKAGEGLQSELNDQPPRAIKADSSSFVRALPERSPLVPLPTWPKDSPLAPGDIVAVTARGMQIIKIDPHTGKQKLLVQGFPYNGPGNNHGVAWHCVAIAPDGHLLIGVDGLDGKEAGVLRIDPRNSGFKVVARGGLLGSGQVRGLAVAADGTIYGIYAGGAMNQPDHIVKIDPVAGSATSIARMERPSGICMDAGGRDFFVASSSKRTVAIWRSGALVPYLTDGVREGCHSAAVGLDGRMFITSLQTTNKNMREIIEVGRGAGHPLKFVAVLPRTDHADMPWNIAVEATGSVLAGPGGNDLTIYRVAADGRQVLPVSSGGLLAGKTAVAVVPCAPIPSSGVPRK